MNELKKLVWAAGKLLAARLLKDCPMFALSEQRTSSAKSSVPPLHVRWVRKVGLSELYFFLPLSNQPTA